MNSWKTIEDGLPEVLAGIYRVRLQDGTEKDAFFYQDAMAWTAFYGMKLSHWWDAQGNHKRLDDVTHWRECATDK